MQNYPCHVRKNDAVFTTFDDMPLFRLLLPVVRQLATLLSARMIFSALHPVAFRLILNILLRLRCDVYIIRLLLLSIQPI